MAFPYALLPAAAPIGDGEKVHGGLRDDGRAAEGYHAGTERGAIESGAGEAL